jgi:hypothetical protein
VLQRKAQNVIGEVRLWLVDAQYFAACFEQLTVFDTGGTDLLTRAAAETTVDVLSKRAGRTFNSSLGHGSHQVEPPSWSIILVTSDDVGRTRLKTQPAMNTGQQFLFFTR